jgi:acetolactate synthase small subunit
MLISKFNKLIHNKALWAVFAILISLAMIGFFAPSGGRSGSENEAPSAGTLFGENISREAFNRARHFNQTFQNQRASDEDEQKRINEETWQRLAILALADDLGITVSNQELNEAIQRDPTFAVNGTFNRQRYQQLIESRMRVRVGTFEEYLRQELILRKMSALVSQSLWVSPYELERSVARLTDRFSIEVVDIAYSNLVEDVTASDEEIQTFYDQHPDAFEIPEVRSVKYVEWPISNYVAAADVSDERVQDYYNAHLEDYAVTDTNDMTTYKSLDEVAADIHQDMAWRAAIGLASEEAMQFTDDLSMMDYGEDVTIDSVAAKRGLTVKTSEFFSAQGEVPGLNVGRSFRDAAFRLQAAPPEDSYSHTIVGDDAIYVMSFNEIQDPRVPALEEVKDEAKSLADDLAKATAFEEKAAAIREQLAAAGLSKLAETAGNLGLPVRTPEPFSVYEASPDDMEDFTAIAPAILGLDEGRISEPIATQTGMAIVAVKAREPGDLALAESLKPDIARTIQSTRMSAHFATWADSILAEARVDADATADVESTE